ncbi:hypothetical protein L7F22_016075 [Adiantum nelumboides]|nr:hypothetical protein [Adiantum nelumboides]
MKKIVLLCSLPPSWDIFCTAVNNSALNGTLVYSDVTSSLLSDKMHRKAMGSSHHGRAHYVQKNGKQRNGHCWNCDSKKEGNRDASKGRSKSLVCCNDQCHYCDKFTHIKKNCYGWKLKIEELNIVQDDCDAQDINMLIENDDVFYDAQETLSLQGFMTAELLVSGEVSHTWILDLGALLHVTPDRHWFTTYGETIGTVTLGESYSCDIVGICDIAMVMVNGVKFTIHNVRHVPALTRNLILHKLNTLIELINMADNNKENRMSIDDFDFAHEDANDDTSMLVNYLVTWLHQAMGDPALQGEVQQQLHAYGILPPIQQERGPERFQGETSKRGLSTEKGVENPYQELKQLLEGKPSSKKKGHAQHERSPSREREESESSAKSMEDVAPRRRRAQRSPTPTK